MLCPFKDTLWVSGPRTLGLCVFPHIFAVYVVCCVSLKLTCITEESARTFGHPGVDKGVLTETKKVGREGRRSLDGC